MSKAILTTQCSFLLSDGQLTIEVSPMAMLEISKSKETIKLILSEAETNDVLAWFKKVDLC